jgi:hypothetical protein
MADERRSQSDGAGDPVGQASIVHIEEAIRRIELDRGLLDHAVSQLSEDDLTAPYEVAGGPLGDACESLSDLLAHVTMWDEINTSVLTEARLGRRHWSLDATWETREAGQVLNASGVAGGRELPARLLLHRFRAVRDALLAELRSYGEDEWLSPVHGNVASLPSIGALAEYVMRVPEKAPYWHVAIHLGESEQIGDVRAERR